LHPTSKSVLPSRFVLILTAFAVLVVGLLATSAAEANPPKQGPSGGGFYKPPKQMPKGHGKLIWQRQATKLSPIEGAKQNKVVLYTSESPQGKPIAVSGSVSVPRGKAPKGGWPVISYAHGTTGTADSCAPTRVGPTSPVAPYVSYIDPQLQDWIDAGYAVVRTDFQGLGTPGPHPYLIGESEGRGVVDIVSAARQLNPNLSNKFLIAGHSQGGQSALFAASLAKSWAPKLKLKGTISYAPASHILAQAEILPALTAPSSLSALAALIFEGASTTSADIDVDALLNPPAVALYPQVDQTCLPQLSAPDSFGGIAPADLLQNPIDSSPEFADVLDGMNPALKIPNPVLIAQGTADTTVFPTFTDQLNAELNDLGDNVDYKTYPGITHGEVVAAAEDDAMDFFEAKLPSGR
jgi:pimeloyl-ACP methyl ester carboxylesterase